MEIDTVTCLALISAITATVSALSAYTSSSTAKKALKYQLNIQRNKKELEIILLLINDLKQLNFLFQKKFETQTEEETDSIPKLIENIKDNIEKIIYIGDYALEKKISNWKNDQILNTQSLDFILNHKSSIQQVFKTGDTKAFFNELISNLLKIHIELLSK